MTDSRIQLVSRGYDALGERFDEWRDRIVGDPREWWRGELASRLDDGARVLELGCGSGVPDTLELSHRFDVTGVDVSARQIARARSAVPRAEFVVADFTELALASDSFDAVVSFYAFNHVPRERLPRLLADIHRWLVPDGLLLAVFGTGDTESWTGEWLGTEMYFSSLPAAENRRALVDSDFDILLDETASIVEPEPDGETTWQWVLARR